MCDLDSPAAYNKMQKVRDKLRNELFTKNKTSVNDLENSNPILYILEPKNVAGQTFANETGYVNCGSSQLSEHLGI